jgi:hypothetical protein
LKSFEYFKIRGDLEDVAIIKIVSNLISYKHKFSRIFPHHISIFQAQKSVFWILKMEEIADVRDLPASG